MEDDRVNREDYMEGDEIYDSTDIWRAVQRELRQQTTYGQRTAKSVLDLAWTITDQARGVFQKRDLHPHLQFIQMFEMEINEIVGYLAISIKSLANSADFQARKGVRYV
jgi:hypothetical protein